MDIPQKSNYEADLSSSENINQSASKFSQPAQGPVNFKNIFFLSIFILFIALVVSYTLFKLITYVSDKDMFSPVSIPVVTDSKVTDSKIIEVDWLKDFDIKKTVRTSRYDMGNQYSSFYKYNKVGIIKEGVFKDNDIYVAIVSMVTDGVYDDDVVHFVLDRDKKVFFLESNGYSVRGISDIPNNLEIFGYNAKFLGKELKIFSGEYSDDGDYLNRLIKLDLENDFGGVYLNPYSLTITIPLPDGSGAFYGLVIPFLNKENGVVGVVFNDNKTNDEQYSTYPTISSVKDLESRLKVTGVAMPSSPIIYLYELSDPNDQILKDLYESKSTYAVMSNTDNPGQSKYTYEEFLNFHPLLYWKDPFGRFVEFKNKRFEVVAEKGKPVIYLYPKEKTILNVQVAPNGGFTKTIPTYPEGGWNVIAYPDSKIIDLSDKKEYPYLFWSGLAFDYPEIKSGWVVSKDKLGKFLEEKLKILGLNEKEIYDFNDYWVGVLSKKPYYLISFVPQNEIDKLSPLSVGPLRPESIIRVLMSAKGLDKPVEIKEQRLPKTPERTGFLVVEWGGALLSN